MACPPRVARAGPRHPSSLPRTAKWCPWYSWVIGKNRRVNRSTGLFFGSDSPPPNSILYAVNSRITPNTYRIQSNRLMRAAPMPIIAPRITSTPMMPQNSTRCWYFGGTPKYPKMTAITNRLSTLSDSSSTYPVRNTDQASNPVRSPCGWTLVGVEPSPYRCWSYIQ
jgi:hypothetical protein